MNLILYLASSTYLSIFIEGLLGNASVTSYWEAVFSSAENQLRHNISRGNGAS